MSRLHYRETLCKEGSLQATPLLGRAGSKARLSPVSSFLVWFQMTLAKYLCVSSEILRWDVPGSAVSERPL